MIQSKNIVTHDLKIALFGSSNPTPCTEHYNIWHEEGTQSFVVIGTTENDITDSDAR